EPGDNPGNEPGDNPGSEPGDNPGSEPGDNPGSEPGDNPGSDGEITPPNNKPLYTSTADAAANSIISTYLANFVDTQTLLQRMGALHQDYEYGIWGRIYGGKLDSFADQGLDSFDMKYYSLQIGADHKWHFENSRLYLGIAASYLQADQDFDKRSNYLDNSEIQYRSQKGSGHLKNYNFYIYATYINDHNFYVDTLFKAGRMKSQFDVRDSANTLVKGKMSLNLFSLSAEIGQRFYFNEDRTGWYITPQAQFTYTKFGSGTFHATNGLNIKVNRRESQLGRLGTEIGYQLDSNNITNLYFRGSYLKEFSDDGQFYLNNSREKYSMKGHWWRYELGATRQFNKRAHGYLNLNYSTGQRFDQKQIEFGYRHEF
ncbi:autotransporter outer membrane beta-barrel domain-containing protein, partial [Ignatzschineria larvae]|uniref:autotransporter outer membrane beta-barrel domain-containing protein n=1 Tax=Ignatzschineria larvae TaxID=112009 RepID=UPI00047AD41A